MAAKADCLDGGDSDLDREGRHATPNARSQTVFGATRFGVHSS